MSRLQQFGFGRLPGFDDGGDPFAGLLPRRQPVADALPQLAPQEQDRVLGDALETGLGGLAYVGKLLDKPGRAVRGGLDMLLGGDAQASELASFLPLSDTLGITSERDAVQGTDLNERLGFTTPGDDGLQNLGAGLLTELALDPLTYVGLGPLTGAGKVLAKTGAGQLPRTLRGRLSGNLVDEAGLLAASPGRRPQDLLQPGESLLTRDAMAKAAADNVPLGPGTPLASLFGIGLPGMDPWVQFGTGPLAQRAAGGVDAVKGAVAASAPVRAVRAALDPLVGGAYHRGVQQVAEETLRPEVRGLQREAATDYTRFQQEAAPFLDSPSVAGLPQRDREQAIADVLRQAAEFDPAPAAVPYSAGVSPRTGLTLRDQARADAAAAGFSPQEADALVKTGQDIGAAAREFAGLERELGLNTGQLSDAYAEYLTRTKNPLPGRKGEGLLAGFRRMFQEFSSTHGSQIARDEMFTDLPGGTVQINRWAKDPTLRQMTDAQRTDFFRQELTGFPTPGLDPAIESKAAKLNTWVKGLPLEHVTQNIDFFRSDPLADFYLRGKRSAQARGSAEAVFDGARRFARPTADFVAAGEDHVPVGELLNTLAMDRGGGTKAREIIADRLGLAVPGVAAMSLPADAARDLVKLGQAWQNPRELGPLLSAWNAAQSMFKSYVTVPFPAFHTRNFMSGLFNAWRDDAFDPAALSDAYKLLRGEDVGLPGVSRDQLIQELVAGNIAMTRDAGRAADTVRAGAEGLIARSPDPRPTGNTLLGDAARGAVDAVPGGRVARTEGRLPTRAEVAAEANPLNIEGVLGDTDGMSLVRQMRVVQAKVDDLVQASHYIAKRRQGYDPEAAALAVKKYQLDYGDLTPTERNLLKAVVPFYSYSRRSLPPLLEDLATKPAKVAGLVRALTGTREPFGEFVPGFIAEGAAVPLGENEDGSRRFISSFGSPVEDESLKLLGNALHGDLGRTLGTALGTMSPLLKAPLEQAFDKQLYSGRNLSDLRPSATASLSGLLDDQQSRIATQVLANTPATRFFSTADRLMDERKGTASSLANLLSGVRVQDVDADRQRLVAARDALKNLLRGDPGVRVGEQLYVPADKLPLLSPEDALLYSAYRGANGAIQKQARQRAAAGL